MRNSEKTKITHLHAKLQPVWVILHMRLAYEEVPFAAYCIVVWGHIATSPVAIYFFVVIRPHRVDEVCIKLSNQSGQFKQKFNSYICELQKSSLHAACLKGHSQVAKLLIENGAMINAQTDVSSYVQYYCSANNLFS